MPPTCIIFLDFILALLGLSIFHLLFSKKSSLSLPPGPTGLPFVGNILDMPLVMEWLTFARWGERYGAVHSPHLQNRIHTHEPRNRRYLLSHCTRATLRHN